MSILTTRRTKRSGSDRSQRPFVKRYRPGRRAREIYSDGDVVSESESTHRLLTIRRDGDEIIAHIREKSQRKIGTAEARCRSEVAELVPRADKLADIDSELEAVHRERLVDNERDIAKMRRWNELGLKERLFILPLGGSAHLMAMAILAFFDYYVFAAAFAIAANVDASFTNPEFWLGGLIGLSVFWAGWLWGRAIKRMNMTVARRSIARRLHAKDPNTDIPEVGSDHLGVVVLFGLVFLSLLYFALVIRLEAEIESYAAIGIQILISVIVVIAEYAFYDPTHIKPVTRTRRHRNIRDTLTETRATIDQSLQRRDALCSQIRAEDAHEVHAASVWCNREEQTLRTLLDADDKNINEQELDDPKHHQSPHPIS